MINKPNIAPGYFLNGVHYWAQWFLSRKPRYEVFAYIGCDREKDLYFFKSRSEKTQIVKTFKELSRGDFKPFLIERKHVQTHLTTIK